MEQKHKRLGAAVAAVLLAGPIAAGILTAGSVAAQRLQGSGRHTQATKAPQDRGDGETDPTVSLPAGSISPAEAQQVAVDYAQQTAPYSTQGLAVQHVQVDDENGTGVYKVTFSSGTGSGLEVTVSASPPAQVLKAEPDGQEEARGSDGEGNDGQGQESTGQQ